MKFYRYDAHYIMSGVDVLCDTFKLVKETPKGYWITIDSLFFYSWKKWISKTSRKRFAYPTKAEALNSFIIRKEKQIIHCERAMHNAKRALSIAKEIKLES